MGNEAFKAKKGQIVPDSVNGGVRAEKGADLALNTSHHLHGDAFFLLLLTGHTMATIGADHSPSVEMQLWAGMSPVVCFGEERGTADKESSPRLQVNVLASRFFYETCILLWGD